MALTISEHQQEKKPLTKKQRVLFAVSSLFIGLILFSLSYIGMRHNTGLGLLNQPILDWMLSQRTPELTSAAKLVTTIANPIYFALITAVIIVTWAAIKHEVRRPLALTVAVGVSALTSFILKRLIMDARPPVVNMVPAFELDYSFPSGHTISIVVLLLVLGYLIYSRHFSYPRVFCWGLATIIIGSAIALSRLYLGYHWLTDVVASAGLGFVILSLFMFVDLIINKELHN